MKGQETPYYYRGDGSTEAFVRIGNESVVKDYNNETKSEAEKS